MKYSDLKNIVEETAGKNSLPSLSVSVWDGEQEFHEAAGFSDLSREISATADTIYAVGSSSKGITAAGIASLVAEKKLDFDAPVKSYMPDFRMYGEYEAEHLTVRDMLCHRCGLPGHGLSLLLGRDRSPEQVAESLAYLRPAFPFRYRFSYSNHMYTLATVLTERVSGQSWSSFLKERIFEPLEMSSTFAFADEVPDGCDRKSAPYTQLNGVNRPIKRDALRHAAGAGAVYSSTRDMLRWLRFQLEGNEKVLPDSLRAELQTPQLLIKRGELLGCDFPEMQMSAYGLGWIVTDYAGVKLIQHLGACNGYRCVQMFVPNANCAVSCATNCDNTEAVYSAAYRLLDGLLNRPAVDWVERWNAIKAAFDFPNPAQELLKKLPAKVNNAQEYVGRYYSPAYGALDITLEDGRLETSIDEGKLIFVPTEGDKFFVASAELKMVVPASFARNNGGDISALEMPLEPALGGLPERFEKQ